MRRWWPISIAAFWAAMLARPLVDIDLFWHLSLGRAVLRAGARVVPEPSAIEAFARKCVVHEWLWDVALYGVHGWLGMLGVALFVMAGGAFAGACVAKLVARWCDDDAPAGARLPAIVIASALVTPLVVARLRERPETIALGLLAISLLLARRMESAAPRQATILGATLGAIALVWAQIHASVVLAPVALVVVAGPELVRRRELRVPALVTLGATILATQTTAHGLGLGKALVLHRSAYVAAHVSEWMPPTWDLLDPDKALHAPAFAVAWLAAIGGMAYARRLAARELRIALLGVLLVLEARRSFGIAGVLLAPLLVRVANDVVARVKLPNARIAAALVACVAAAPLLHTVVWVHRHEGPLGRLGVDQGLEPVGAASLLRTMPAGARVLSSQRASAELGFRLDGHVRTYVDGRVPLLFDPSELAVARAVWSDPSALPIATAEYGFDVAVVEHTLPICEGLAASDDWTPVLVEPQFATFARKGTPLASQPMTHVHPCTHAFVDAASCAPDGGRSLDAEIGRIAQGAGEAFARYLGSERMVYCAAANIDADAALANLGPRERAGAFLPMQDSLIAFLHAAAGDPSTAVRIIAPHVADGDAWVLSRSIAALGSGSADDLVRPLLERLARDRGDQAPPWVVVTLANVCARQGDAACAAIHGLYAGVRGDLDVAPALCWLSRSHERPETRAQAAALLGVLDAKGRAGTPPRLVRCP